VTNPAAHATKLAVLSKILLDTASSAPLFEAFFIQMAHEEMSKSVINPFRKLPFPHMAQNIYLKKTCLNVHYKQPCLPSRAFRHTWILLSELSVSFCRNAPE
jgi:hypothetical protein